MGLVNIVGAELSSLEKRNNCYIKERDVTRAKVDLVRSELQAKHCVELEAAYTATRSKPVEEYKASKDFRSMQDDLYTAGMNNAVKILGP